ncbi:MAG TPA: DegT/DnrJ/EryC1/StrS family aminotransferase, partial [Holophagaceae bacterium]
ESPIGRNELVQRLNEARIGTRLLFGGNLLRQPAFRDTPRRVVGSLDTCDRIMRDTFWVGVYPALTESMLSYVGETLARLLQPRTA